MGCRGRARHICPWWIGYGFDNPCRRIRHDWRRILGPYVQPGMRVADIGCGGGYFTVALARLVGSRGTVLAVDVQGRALARLRRRLRRARAAERVEVRQCAVEALTGEVGYDFVLAFWMVHEAGDRSRLFQNVWNMLNPGGRFLMVEPWFHVPRAQFEASVRQAGAAGFRVARRFRIRMSRAALLVKPE